MSVLAFTRLCPAVALRKESVDRNQYLSGVPRLLPPSLSARRAWIEIPRYALYLEDCSVALRKESVDRNRLQIRPAKFVTCVALRKESVDRNQVTVHFVTLSACRSPQGERG